jgi:translation initiation factor IF-3
LEVRVIGVDGKQLGIFNLRDAINLARANSVDLVEIAPTANPPVCRLVDYGKFRYEQSKKDKEAKKHQHANKVKEIQLSPSIDPHDFGVKLGHAVDFLCDEIKVKVTLKFRGREMAHTEFGFQQVQKFVGDVSPYGHPDAPAKMLGKSITVMLSPLPRNKRAKNPRQQDNGEPRPAVQMVKPAPLVKPSSSPPAPQVPNSQPAGFANNPFADLKTGSAES